MPILLDKKSVSPPFSRSGNFATVGDAVDWVRTLVPEGRVIVQVQLDGCVLEAPFAEATSDALEQATLALTTGDQKELSLTTLGKLAALIEWLAPQHRDVAGMLERGETQKALQRLTELLVAWQQIQGTYGNLAKMLGLSLQELSVHRLNGEAVLNEFCHQLEEIQAALKNHDFVLLSDILQYEMDGAIANWMALLEATLGVVEPDTCLVK